MTGGRPCRTMRETSPAVWTMAPAQSRPKAAGRRISGFQTQEAKTVSSARM